jgi:hypothetical protein
MVLWQAHLRPGRCWNGELQRVQRKESTPATDGWRRPPRWCARGPLWNVAEHSSASPRCDSVCAMSFRTWTDQQAAGKRMPEE